MESRVIQRNRRRIKRAGVARQKLRGSAERPRLSVIKSNQHIGVQLIDDDKGMTLAAADTRMKKFRDKGGKNKAAAQMIGKEIARLAKEKNIGMVVFDRGFRQYHGALAELAEAARAGGLQF